ncbi:MAG TPA: aldehyde dehydrogenase family protein [Thermoanaerobaculaceae bacterium]|nr:aldehyde dehydrogenase family protein [Thermoanaerobaculaceae bacterium]HRS16939.1 aldehyde dehydrogenase family protein [Thermoanaerobaculaceae bacterium]
METRKLLIGGRWEAGAAGVIEVRSPFDGAPVARVARASAEQLAAAAGDAAGAAAAMAALAPAERADILERAAARLRARRDDAVGRLVAEAGKPVSLARLEADRAVDVLADSAHVARYPLVEARDLGGYASGAGRLALVRRVPVGPVLAITPFNFPLMLVAHKLGPAVAAGCPVVLKPASQTPSPALLLAEVLLEAGLPPEGLSVLPAAAADMEPLVRDPRFRLLTFTGSMEVGWALKRAAWDRRVALELGGNAAAIVEPDAGDLAAVAARLAFGAYAFAGQSCISVQRILVHEAVWESFRDAMTAAARGVSTGDPREERTVCGPLVDAANAARVARWIEQAVEAGGRLLAGGTRAGNVVAPTLLEGAPPDQPVVADEVFGPVAVLQRYRSFEEALALANASRYGLQAGVFTSDLGKVRRAWEVLEVGGVIQGDMPTWRSDPMPYGGVKASGTGREGPASAVLEMTEERLLVLR